MILWVDCLAELTRLVLVIGYPRMCREVDAPVKKANTQLVRSVPKMYKQSLKELLAPYGFKGFKIAELTPNRTRRAQVRTARRMSCGHRDMSAVDAAWACLIERDCLLVFTRLLSLPSDRDVLVRAAQVCNWVLYYKRNLWGVPLEELMRRKDEVTQVTRDGETSEQLAKKMVY